MGSDASQYIFFPNKNFAEPNDCAKMIFRYLVRWLECEPSKFRHFLTLFQEAQNGKKCAQETSVDFNAQLVSIKP